MVLLQNEKGADQFVTKIGAAIPNGCKGGERADNIFATRIAAKIRFHSPNTEDHFTINAKSLLNGIKGAGINGG